MAPTVTEVSDDLAATATELRELLEHLDPTGWDAPTPAPGWTVRHQVRHLAQGEELGGLAATDSAAFGKQLVRMLGDLASVESATTAPDPEATADLLDRWWTAATALRTAVLAKPAGERIQWVTGPMSGRSFLGARVMETFAHGHDIGVAVGAVPAFDAALPHVARLGVATRGFSFANRGLPAPTAEVRVDLTGPHGEAWSWGPGDADDVVTGPALGFCLLVTQRQHRDDTGLEASGPTAEAWLAIAQCFAGPPTDGPPPST